jgi:hypothetical protein
MNQFDPLDSPFPNAYSAGTACRHWAANSRPGSRHQRLTRKALSRFRPVVLIAAVFGGLMIAGCTALPQTSSSECVGPLSYCQPYYGS